MTVLHLSIATSSLVKQSLPEASRQQPCIVRLCAALCDDAGQITDSFSCGIRAEGRKIETAASRIHGITSAQAERSGVYEMFALGMVCGLRASGPRRPNDYPGMASNARYVVGWNVEFIRSVIGSLFARHGEPSQAWVRPGLSFLDLQSAAAPWCKLAPSETDDGQYRKPTRDEAAQILLAGPYSARPLPHSVDSNLALEMRLFDTLRSRKAFELEAVA